MHSFSVHFAEHYQYDFIHISLYIHVNVIRHDSLSVFMNPIIQSTFNYIKADKSVITTMLYSTKHCSLNMFCQLNLHLLTFSAALMCHGEVITIFLRSKVLVVMIYV